MTAAAIGSLNSILQRGDLQLRLVAFVATLAVVIVLADAGGVGAAAGGCSAAIGFEGPVTGPVAVLGDEQLAFAQLAVAADNEANGTNISLVEGDTRLSPAKARSVTRQFTSDSNIVAVVGPAGSLEVEAVGPLMAHAGMPFITGSATLSTLTDGANPTFFRVVSSSSLEGPGDARYIIHKLHPRAVMLIDDREPYSTGLASSMIPLWRKAGIRVDHESVSQRVTDFSSLAAKVTRKTGVIVLPWQIAANAEQFGKALAKQHKKAVIFGTDGLQSSAFTIPGSYVSAFGPAITAIPADAAIAAGAKAKYPNYGTFGPPVYAATDVVAGAIAAVCRAGKQPTRDNVLAQIRLTNEPKSILGQPIRFTSNGELEGAHWFIFRIDRKHHYRMLVTAKGTPVVPDGDRARRESRELEVTAIPSARQGSINSGAPLAATAASATSALVMFRVPSPSMLPTLEIGSEVTVNLHAYRSRKPAIGDIIVFHPPRGAARDTPVCGLAAEGAGHSRPCGLPTRQRSNEEFVERIVGLPGDKISIVNGHVVRNGVRERDPYIARCGVDSSCNFRSPVLIPRGDYFTMGDNRGESDDGRFWGPIHKSWIIGEVVSDGFAVSA